MTVAEFTSKDADLVLRSMYYKEDLNDEDYDEYEGEHWGELSYSLGRTMTWSSELSRHIDIEPGEDFNGVRVICVQDVGGGEGQGETRYVVFSFTDDSGTKYFRKDGYYASYDGTTWDGDFKEVTPQERVVVFYE